MQPLDWPHDTNHMRYENYSVVTEEIVVHALRNFASQFAQRIIYFIRSTSLENRLTLYHSECSLNENLSVDFITIYLYPPETESVSPD